MISSRNILYQIQLLTSGKLTIHAHGDVVLDFSSLGLREQHVSEESRNGTSSSGNSGGDSGKSTNISSCLTRDGQSTARVESIPTNPQDKSPQNLKGDGMGRE